MDLLVVAKEPIPGRVKTRLTPPCDPVEAAAIAAGCLADTLQAATSSGADRVVVALDGEPGPWWPSGVEVVSQGRGRLADRLATAWRTTEGPALQIGMDTPQLTGATLDAAMACLLEGDGESVLGPAVDGGWWSIGLRRPHPGAFAGIPTSRGDTGSLQLARLEALGLRPSVLPALRDVDTWPDALAVARLAPDGAFAAAVSAAGSVGR